MAQQHGDAQGDRDRASQRQRQRPPLRDWWEREGRDNEPHDYQADRHRRRHASGVAVGQVNEVAHQQLIDPEAGVKEILICRQDSDQDCGQRQPRQTPVASFQTNQRPGQEKEGDDCIELDGCEAVTKLHQG